MSEVTNIIEITDLINPNFYEVWLNDLPYTIAHGGRSSMKSSVISLKLVTDFESDPLGNVVCLRKVGKYLSTSVYEQIKWAIYMLELENNYTFGKSPLVIKHKDTDTAFYFYGVDDPQKLKSAKIAKGHVMALWYEELAEFSGVEDIDIVEDTFIREDLGGDKKVKVYFSYNPPRNPYEWVNEWLNSKRGDSDYLIHGSTYKDDEKGFLSKQMIDKILKYKANDYDYYRWMYEGAIIGMGDNVYNMDLFHPITELPSDDRLLLIDFAIDTGHQVSATACCAFGLTAKRNVILLDTYYYSPAGRLVKKAPSELTEELYDFMDKVRKKYNASIDVRTIDSAEGGIRNQMYLDYGVQLHPVAKSKKADMIDNVQDLLAQGRVYYMDIEANQVVIEEHRKYQWDPKTIKTGKPEVVKEDDHTADVFQYYVKDNMQKLDLVY